MFVYGNSLILHNAKYWMIKLYIHRILWLDHRQCPVIISNTKFRFLMYKWWIEWVWNDIRRAICIDKQPRLTKRGSEAKKIAYLKFMDFPKYQTQIYSFDIFRTIFNLLGWNFTISISFQLKTAGGESIF